MSMKLDWNKIVSNAVTVLVASVFVGAAVKLWSGVETIDERISDNLTSIRATQNVLAPKVDAIEDELEAITQLLLDQAAEEEPLVVADPRFLPPTVARPRSLDMIEQDYREQKIGPR